MTRCSRTWPQAELTRKNRTMQRKDLSNILFLCRCWFCPLFFFLSFCFCLSILPALWFGLAWCINVEAEEFLFILDLYA